MAEKEKTPKELEQERRKNLPSPSNVVVIPNIVEFTSQLDKLGNLLKYFGKKEKESKIKLKYHDFYNYEVKMRAFILQLETFLNAQSDILKNSKYDAAGREIVKPPAERPNSYEGLFSYNFAIIYFDPGYTKIESVILTKTNSFGLIESQYNLVKNVKTEEGIIAVPYKNIFDPTIIRILSVHQELSEKMKDKRAEAKTFSCGQTNVANDVANKLGNIAGLGTNFFSIYDPPIETDILWTDFANKYFNPFPGVEKEGKIKIEPKKITIEDVKKVSKKYDQNSEKTEEQLRQEELDFSSREFNFAIARQREKQSDAVKYNINLDFKIDKALSSGKKALDKCYTDIVNKFHVGCLIKEAADCLIPPVSCKEIVRGFRLSELEKILVKILPPATAKELGEKISKSRQEKVDQKETEFENLKIQKELEGKKEEIPKEREKTSDEATDDILNEIEKYIDLEIICDIIKLIAELIAGKLEFPPKFNFDIFSLINLNRNISTQINDTILAAAVAAICKFLEATIEQLTNCNYLDKFIAGAIEDPNGPFGKQVGDLMLKDLMKNVDDYSTMLAKEVCSNISVNNATDINFFGLNINETNPTGQLGKTNSNISFNPGKLIGGINKREEIPKTEQDIYDNIGTFNLKTNGDRYSVIRTNKDGQTLVTSSETSKKTSTGVISLFSGYASGMTEEEILAQQNTNALRLSGLQDCEGLKNLIKSSIQDIVSNSTPGEVLKWMSGSPPESIRIRLEQLSAQFEMISITSGSIDAPERQVKNRKSSFRIDWIPKNLFDQTGISTTAQEIILLAQTQEGRSTIRDIPLRLPGFCAVPRIEQPEQPTPPTFPTGTLPSGTFTYPEYVTTFVESTETFTNRINEIKCNINSGLMPDGRPDPNVDKALNNVFSTIYDPVKASFDREIGEYMGAISDKTKKEITHKEKIKDFQGKEADNPEFLMLKNSGYKVENNEIKQTKQVTNYAYFLKNNLVTSNFDVRGDFRTSVNFSIESSYPYGVKEKLDEVSEILKPDVINNIKDEALRKKMQLYTDDLYKSHIDNKLPPAPKNTIDITLERITNRNVDQLVVSSFGAIAADTKVIERNFVYTADEYVNQTTRANNLLPQQLKDKTQEIIKNIKNNDNGAYFIFVMSNNETGSPKLSDINLSPVGLVDGCDKSLLKVRNAKDMAKEIFKNIAKEECDNTGRGLNNGDKPSSSAVSRAATHVMILLLAKIYCIEFILKTLNIAMSVNFKKQIIFSEEVKSFIAFEMMKDMQRLGIYETYIANLEDAHKNITKIESSSLRSKNVYTARQGVKTNIQNKDIAVQMTKNIIEFISVDILAQFYENVGLPREQIKDSNGQPVKDDKGNNQYKKISEYVLQELTQEQINNYEDKIYSLLLINACLLTSTPKMLNLFEATKRTIRDAMINAGNSGNYMAKSSYDQDGGYMQSSERALSNMGGTTDESWILFWLLRAPLYVYRGFSEVIDPNNGISAAISKLGESGLLLPDISLKDAEPCENIKSKEELEDKIKQSKEPIKFPEDFDIKYPGQPFKIPYILTGFPLLFAGVPITPFGIVGWVVDLLLLDFLPANKKASYAKCDTNQPQNNATESDIPSAEEVGINCNEE